MRPPTLNRIESPVQILTLAEANWCSSEHDRFEPIVGTRSNRAQAQYRKLEQALRGSEPSDETDRHEQARLDRHNHCGRGVRE